MEKTKLPDTSLGHDMNVSFDYWRALGFYHHAYEEAFVEGTWRRVAIVVGGTVAFIIVMQQIIYLIYNYYINNPGGSSFRPVLELLTNQNWLISSVALMIIYTSMIFIPSSVIGYFANALLRQDDDVELPDSDDLDKTEDAMIDVNNLTSHYAFLTVIALSWRLIISRLALPIYRTITNNVFGLQMPVWLFPIGLVLSALALIYGYIILYRAFKAVNEADNFKRNFIILLLSTEGLLYLIPRILSNILGVILVVIKA